MNIVAFGISHKNTPIDIREQFSLSPLEQELLLSELKNNPGILEVCVLSTCHRVEIYAHLLEGVPELEAIVRPLCAIKEVPFLEETVRHFYRYQGEAAVQHLFRVAAGLESMVLGEDQILGQARNAFERAQSKGMFSKHFNILANMALRTGKKARHESHICTGGSSVSWAAIAKVEKELGSLEGKKVLVIGAGKMSELAVGHIQNRGFRQLYLMNRTPAHAENLAEKYGGQVVPFCDMKEILSEVDACICSVDAPHYILGKETVCRVMALRTNRRLIFVDISMPRNIDPQVGELPGVSLYQIDDLQEVVEATMQMRANAVADVERIIAEKVSQFYARINKGSWAEIEDGPEDPTFSAVPQ